MGLISRVSSRTYRSSPENMGKKHKKDKKEKKDKEYDQYERDDPDKKKQTKKQSHGPSSIDFSGRPRAVTNAMQQHKELIQNYIRYYGGKASDLRPDPSSFKTDIDVVRENHKFIWDSDSEDDDGNDSKKRTWHQRVAKHYWDRLNKEYCIADLSRYKEKMYAFRWRTEDEVVKGTGQFTCGNKACKLHVEKDLDELSSFEVMFNYREHSEKKSALVKVRVCEKCEKKLNYHTKHKRAKKKKRKKESKDDMVHVKSDIKEEA